MTAQITPDDRTRSAERGARGNHGASAAAERVAGRGKSTRMLTPPRARG